MVQAPRSSKSRAAKKDLVRPNNNAVYNALRSEYRKADFECENSANKAKTAQRDYENHKEMESFYRQKAEQILKHAEANGWDVTDVPPKNIKQTPVGLVLP